MPPSKEGFYEVYESLSEVEMRQVMKRLNLTSIEKISETAFRVDASNKEIGKFRFITQLQDNGEVFALSFIVAGQNVSLQKLNDWNSNGRFTKAYISNQGNITLKGELLLMYGVSLDTITNLSIAILNQL